MGGTIVCLLGALVACNRSEATNLQTGSAVAPADPASPAVSATPPAPTATYAVFDVKGDDVLNVRAEPDGSSKKVYSFSPAVTRIRLTGRRMDRGGTPWVEVGFEGGTGWVNRLYLTEMHPDGCNDPNLIAAIRKFMHAASSADGAALREIVSPLRGLHVRYSAGAKGVTFPAEEVEGIFTSPVPKSWGLVGEGDPPTALTGSFREVVAGSLEQALVGKGAKEKCGALLMGGTAGSTEWPAELSRLTQVSFHDPSEANEHWQTWVAGFEYVDGKPYVAMLIGYRWEM
jgi:hypothetical protein